MAQQFDLKIALRLLNTDYLHKSKIGWEDFFKDLLYLVSSKKHRNASQNNLSYLARLSNET